MRLLITGGAGYIGSHLTDALLREGHTVTILDNFKTGKRAHLAAALASGECTVVEGDIRDRLLVQRLVRASEGVYHLAAIVGVRHVIEHPLEMMLVNVDGSSIVLAAAAEANVPILIASSSEVYGEGTHAPFIEGEPSVIGPTSQPRWGYALAKAIDEHLAFAYTQDRQLPTVAVRYFNSYGPRIDKSGYGSVIAKFIDQAIQNQPLTIYGDGTQSRAFTYIDDTVRGTMLAFEAILSRPEVQGHAFNVGYPQETTILELAEQIIALTGATSTLQFVSFEEAYGPGFAEPRRRVPDMSKSAEVLHFLPAIPLDEGLQRTIEWARQAFQRV